MDRQRYLGGGLCFIVRHEVGKPFVAQLYKCTGVLGQGGGFDVRYDPLTLDPTPSQRERFERAHLDVVTYNPTWQ